MRVKKDIISKDFSIFNGKLKSLTNENIGLEYFLISNYSFFNYNIIKTARTYILNHFYKEDKMHYEYSDILTFFSEKDFTQSILKFKDILDIFILRDIEPDFINIRVTDFKDGIAELEIEYT